MTAVPCAAFYTPLKHPSLEEPSGDREIARMLMAALAGCGLDPELASRLASWRRRFDPTDAARLERRAALVADLLIRRYRRRAPLHRPRLWLTYQNYHRAPDFLGPPVASALAIPYVIVDTAVSGKSRRGEFRPWASAARAAVRRADLIFAMSPRDLPALARLRGPEFAASRLLLLPPAVDLSRFDHATANRGMEPVTDAPLLLCVAMMRHADKLDSYRLLAAALAHLYATRPGLGWQLVVAGDGPARGEVEAAFDGLPRERVRFLGEISPERLPRLYRAAEVLVFPGLGEALGLVYVEAAAAGLPVVACHGPGQSVTVAPGGGLLTEPTAEAFAVAVSSLLDDPERRALMGAAARRFAAAHTREVFRRRLAEGLARLGGHAAVDAVGIPSGAEVP